GAAMEQEEALKKAIGLMKRRIEQGDPTDPNMGDLYMRLAEMYFKLANIYERKQFDLLDQQREAEDSGNAAASAQLDRDMQAAGAEVTTARNDANTILAEFLREFPGHPDEAKALFYLSYNLSEAGQQDEAQLFIEQLL